MKDVRNFGKLPTYTSSNGHDDFIMSMIWSFYALKMDILERYYDVRKIVLNKLGEQMPLFILPYKVSNELETNDYMSRLEKNLDSFRYSYEKRGEEIADEVKNSNVDDFIRKNKLNALNPNNEEDAAKIASSQQIDNNNDDTFSFSVF